MVTDLGCGEKRQTETENIGGYRRIHTHTQPDLKNQREKKTE